MKNIRKERGQSLVELSISILILLLLLVGAVEFGMAFFQFVQLRDAAQEGALYGSLHPYIDNVANGKYDAGEPVNLAGIETRVRASSNSPVDLTVTSGPKAVTVTAVSSDGTNLFCEGHGLTVTVSFNHEVFMPFMTQIVGNTIPLIATVTDTILTPRCPGP